MTLYRFTALGWTKINGPFGSAHEARVYLQSNRLPFAFLAISPIVPTDYLVFPSFEDWLFGEFPLGVLTKDNQL